MSEKLTQGQTNKLIDIVVSGVSKLEVEMPAGSTKEIPYTSQHLVPAIKGIVADINKPGLYVRGEGAQPVKSIYKAEMEFKPDISIGFHHNLYIAFEVKIIRPGDPSGSFSKAIGQGITYLALGDYEASIVLLFDTRKKAPIRTTKITSEIENRISNLFIFTW
jgi:hypothetical protein